MSGKQQRIEDIIRNKLLESKTTEISEEDPLLAPKRKLTPEEHAKRNKAKSAAYDKDDKDDKDDKKEKKEMAKEETEAASSLKPAAKAIADPQALSTSSLGRMSGVMSAMSNMNTEDQVSFFNQVMGQYGPGKTYGVGDNSEQNKSTLNMKPSAASGGGGDVKMPMPQINAKEDIEQMFVGQDLTEEFKEKASVLFEAAVNAKVIAEVAQLEEQYASAITEELKLFTEEVTDKLDAYLDYVVENWMSENEVAIESTLRNELMDEFVVGLKNLFSEHYINVPESKIDVVETLTNKVEELETQLDESITENVQMKEILSDVAKKEIFEGLSIGLALTQQEKFKTLVEGIEYDGDIDAYEKKLRIIKETYFNSDKKVISSNIQEETFEGATEQVNVDPVVNKYVQALSRTVKKQ